MDQLIAHEAQEVRQFMFSTKSTEHLKICGLVSIQILFYIHVVCHSKEDVIGRSSHQKSKALTYKF